MNSNDRLSPFDALDDREGPAVPLSREAALAQADTVVRRALGKRRDLIRVAFLAAGLVATTGAAAAVLWQSSAPRPAPRQTQDTAPGPRRAESTPHHTETLATAAERPPESTPRPRDVGVRSVVLHSSRDGLQRANAARARKEFARAERLYLRVASLHPGSDDAAAADLAAAELRYQHLGRPRDALPLYNKLLQAQAQGPLAEQARAGIARAYAILGDKTAERIAWQTLLRQHPKSWFVVEARTRLEALQSSSSRPAEIREVK